MNTHTSAKRTVCGSYRALRSTVLMTLTLTLLIGISVFLPAVFGFMAKDNGAVVGQGIYTAFGVAMVYADVPMPAGNTGAGVPAPTGNTQVKAEKVSFQNPLKPEFSSVEKLLAELVKLAVRLGTLVAIFFFIYAGFRYVTAMGDESKLKDAKKTLTNAAIGTAILVGANVIVTLVQNTINSIQN